MQRLKGEAGLTVVELLVGLTLSGLVLGGILMVGAPLLRQQRAVQARTQMHTEARRCLESLQREVQGAAAIRIDGPDRLTLTLPGGALTTYGASGSQVQVNAPGGSRVICSGLRAGGLRFAPEGGHGVRMSLTMDLAGRPVDFETVATSRLSLLGGS